MKTRKKHLTAVQQIWASLFLLATLLPVSSAHAQNQRTVRSLQEGARRLVHLTQSARNLRALPQEQANLKQREYVLRYNRILAQTHLLRIALERTKSPAAAAIETARRAEELRYRTNMNNNCQFLDEIAKGCAQPFETAPGSKEFKLRLGQVAVGLFNRETPAPVKSQLLPVDLSSKFQTPVSQVLNGKMTKAGIGFALAEAVSFATHKTISPWMTYALLNNFQKELATDCESLKLATFDTVITVALPDDVLMQPASCLVVDKPTATLQITDSKTVSGGITNFVNELKKGKPVFVTLTTSSRRSKEDWVQFTPSDSTHAVLVVGYGEGYNPFTLKYEPYFILRDSYTTKPIHLKTSATEFLRVISGAKVIRSAVVSEEAVNN